jgi:two-component system sensor histidine kinase/response regulator
VLLVEDSPVNLEVGVGVLQNFGCIVDTATNGVGALQRHQGGDYDLIFMDCQMPEMDGFETTTRIRQREAASGRHTPIIALTASAIEGDRERCLEAGMDDYLTKPFTSEQIGSMLAAFAAPGAAEAADRPNRLTVVAANPPSADPIDGQVLDALQRLRPGIVPRVIALFFESTPPLLQQLETGAQTGDADMLQRASHTLKSSSANVGAAGLSSRCRELEARAQSGAVPDAQSAVGAIIAEYRLVETALAARLPKVA